MHNRTDNDSLRKYKKFNMFRKIIGVAMVVIIVPIVFCFIKAMILDDGLQIIFWVVMMLLYIVIIAVLANMIVKYDAKLAKKAYNNKSEIIHNGLFGKIWDEFDAAPCSDIAGGKVIFLEMYNNTIDLQVIRNKHEFNIVIDSDILYVEVDEEELYPPLELEVKLSEISSIECFWQILTDFIKQYS